MTTEERIARVDEGMYDYEQRINTLEMQNAPSFATLNNPLEGDIIREPEPQGNERIWDYIMLLRKDLEGLKRDHNILYEKVNEMALKASRKKRIYNVL